jgi:putative (di)nucleoside polyphosphate hydrolase
MTNPKNLPYRKGVGMMIINQESKVFVGKRIDTKTRGWQMPQGGMNTGETPSRAVFREMKEELGTNKGEIIAESKYWYSYDLPEFLVPKLWDGAYKGQKQKWFLIRYTGSDEDINIKTATPEFYEWSWVDIEDLPVMIVHFKKKLYNAVLKEFEPLVARKRNYY